MEFICKINGFKNPILYIKKVIIERKMRFPILLLSGEMGSGKTTFTAAFVHSYNPDVWVNSPSFSLMNEYELQNETFIYHFDLYRLGSVQELEELGFEEYWGKQGISIVEWWKIAKNYFESKREVIPIEFSVIDDNTRKIDIF